MTIKFMWHNVPQGDIVAIETAIKADLDAIGNLHSDPSWLITHTVFLGKSMDEGPVVHVWGEEDDNVFIHCEWESEIKWVTLPTLPQD
mgnify:CR=1 FL=1